MTFDELVAHLVDETLIELALERVDVSSARRERMATEARRLRDEESLPIRFALDRVILFGIEGDPVREKTGLGPLLKVTPSS